jgi:hypothetical protein
MRNNYTDEEKETVRILDLAKNEFLVEDGIPLPIKGNSLKQSLIEVLRSMKVGQSVFVANKKTKDVGYKLSKATSKSPGQIYTSRTVDGGCRIWRVE